MMGSSGLPMNIRLLTIGGARAVVGATAWAVGSRPSRRSLTRFAGVWDGYGTSSRPPTWTWPTPQSASGSTGSARRGWRPLPRRRGRCSRSAGLTLDKVETITAFAKDMSEFLKTSELTESRAFIRSFVKEIEVRPGRATIHYTIPTPEDSSIGGADAAEVALNGSVCSTVHGGGPVLTVGSTIFELWLGRV